MSLIKAYEAVGLGVFDLHALAGGAMTVYQNVWVGTGGYVYEDFVEILYAGGSLGFAFGGEGITSSGGAITGGSITGFGTAYRSGSTWVDVLSFDGLLPVGGAALWAAVQSADTADDAQWFRQALSGSDTILLSPGADAFRGHAGDDLMRGRDGADLLYGDAGNDTLDGGSAADTLHGGIGDDIFQVDTESDRVIEIAGQGFDTVEARVSYRLGAAIEALTLVGTAVAGTGNAAANTLTGQAAANRLEGLGGADTLSGAGGNDTLVGSAGLDAIYGGAGRDALDGGADDDTLDGGTGADTMSGGRGDDLYLVDASTDRVVERPGEGTDRVESSASFRLGADIEQLVLTGSDAIDGRGHAIGNTITGNGAANRLDGLGGDDVLDGGVGDDTLAGGNGNDTLIGSSGSDWFVFATLPNAGSNVDTILYPRFHDGYNFALDGSVFTGIGPPGPLDRSLYVLGTQATEAHHRIVHDVDTGRLYHDPDGTGPLEQVLFAQQVGDDPNWFVMNWWHVL